jgi:dephospho-CoA kinase
MLIAGVTGGIGSGKSVVCRVFHTLGIPVFNADDAARHLMEHDEALKRQVSLLLGDEVYPQGALDRAKVSAIIFSEPAKLQQLNALVHPATISYARQWISKQASPYVIKEAALFFESGSYKEVDVMIGVYAPAGLRIQRAMKRSAWARAQVEAIMARQMNEEEKMKRCGHVVTNDGITPVLPQVLALHNMLKSGSI